MFRHFLKLHLNLSHSNSLCTIGGIHNKINLLMTVVYLFMCDVDTQQNTGRGQRATCRNGSSLSSV